MKWNDGSEIPLTWKNWVCCSINCSTFTIFSKGLWVSRTPLATKHVAPCRCRSFQGSLRPCKDDRVQVRFIDAGKSEVGGLGHPNPPEADHPFRVMSLAHFPWSLWDYSSYVFYDSNEHDLFVSLDLEVVFRVYSVVMCRFDLAYLGFNPLLTIKQNCSEYTFGEPVERAHLWTWLDTPAAGFPQRFLLEKCVDSAGGCGCALWIHQDKEREIPAVPADSHSMSSGTKTKAAWHSSWMFFVGLFVGFWWLLCMERRLNMSTSKRDRGLRFLLIPRLAGVFVELKNSRNYFKSHFINLHYSGLYENRAPPRPDGGHHFSNQYFLIFRHIHHIIK